MSIGNSRVEGSTVADRGTCGCDGWSDSHSQLVQDTDAVGHVCLGKILIVAKVGVIFSLVNSALELIDRWAVTAKDSIL